MQPKRSNSRFKRGVVGVVAVLLVCAGVINTVRPLPAVAVTPQTITAPMGNEAPIGWPAAGEASLEAQGVTPLMAYGGDKPLPTASVAKVITALAVLQQKPLSANQSGPLITITQTDVDIYNKYVAADGSVVPVTVGEQISEYEALEALMLPSANNMADTLAAWAYDSFNAYRTAATHLLAQWGLENTTIGSDASGLSPDTTSTPGDLVHLGERALNNPVLAQIVSQRSATLPVAGTVYNVNALLGQDGIVGIKTGNSDQAGGCLLFAAKVPLSGSKTVTVIGAVMGQADLNSALNAALPLVDSAKANLYLATPIHAGQTVATYTTPWGAHTTASSKQDITFAAWKGTTVTVKTDLQKKLASYVKGTDMGTVTVSAGQQSDSSHAVLAADLARPSLWWRVTRH